MLDYLNQNCIQDAFVTRIWTVLIECQPFPGDDSCNELISIVGPRFVITRRHVSKCAWRSFNLGRWYAEECADNSEVSEILYVITVQKDVTKYDRCDC